MSLYESWRALAEQQLEVTPAQGQAFWKEYYALEKGVYTKLLSENRTIVEGKVGELAEAFELEPIIFAGFLDGINESIEPVLDLDALEADSEISFTIDLEKLFYNMLNAKADWLYDLPEWDGLLTLEQREEIRRKWRTDRIVRVEAMPGRNDPCPCGSGKKYKKCCGAN